MKLLISYLFITIALAIPLTALAGDSMLRVICEGEDVGAEVYVNGKIKGECPVDMRVAPGKLNLRVVKGENEFVQKMYIGDGVVKKVEAVLTLNAAAQKRIDDAARVIHQQNEQYKQTLGHYFKRIKQMDAEENAKLAEIAINLQTQSKFCDDNYYQSGTGVGSFALAVLSNGAIDSSHRECRTEAVNKYIEKSKLVDKARPVRPNSRQENEIGLQMIPIPRSNFEMSRYEVTQAQWRTVMGNNPSNHQADNLPVEQVSWYEVQEFLKILNQKVNQNYRLPTSVEWELACFAGQTTKFCGSDVVDQVGWSSSNSANYTHPVGQLSPNGFGLYDLSGNVWEMVEEQKVRGASAFEIVENVGRGGGGSPVDVSSKSSGIGFRVVRTLSF